MISRSTSFHGLFLVRVRDTIKFMLASTFSFVIFRSRCMGGYNVPLLKEIQIISDTIRSNCLLSRMRVYQHNLLITLFLLTETMTPKNNKG